MQAITPMLWFDTQAEEAADFYVDVFSRLAADKGPSKILGVSRYGEAGPGQKGSVMTVSFMLCGQEFTALNGGPHFTFTEAISFVVPCDSQRDIDAFWEALIARGEVGQCGWLKDRFGLSWQITPSNIDELLSTPEAVQAMLQMHKLDIDALKKAGSGG